MADRIIGVSVSSLHRSAARISASSLRAASASMAVVGWRAPSDQAYFRRQDINQRGHEVVRGADGDGVVVIRTSTMPGRASQVVDQLQQSSTTAGAWPLCTSRSVVAQHSGATC